MPKTYSFREIVQRLHAHDDRFVFHFQAKGSHRVIEHPDIGGKRKRVVVPFHGRGGDVKPAYIGLIRRTFGLPDGVL